MPVAESLAALGNGVDFSRLQQRTRNARMCEARNPLCNARAARGACQNLCLTSGQSGRLFRANLNRWLAGPRPGRGCDSSQIQPGKFVPTGSRRELEKKARDLQWAKDNLDENRIHVKASIYKDAKEAVTGEADARVRSA